MAPTIQTFNELLNNLIYHYPNWAIYALLIVIGCCVGSFLNVIIYRRPLIAKEDEEMYIYENYNIGNLKKKSVNTKRSHCPHCHSQVSNMFNIPVIGWILLRGRTKCCGKSLSLTYPIIEIFTGSMFALSLYLIGSVNTLLITLLVMISSLIVINMIDFRHKLIFDLHATVYCFSSVLFMYSLAGNAEFIVNAMMSLVVFFSIIKGYELLRNTIMGTNLVMMGSGDWSLWFILFAACSVLSDARNLQSIEPIAAAMVGVLLLGALTIVAKVIIIKLGNTRVPISQEFPAAPSITITTLITLFLLLI